MTAVQSLIAPLSTSLPRLVCPFQVQIGDLVAFKGEHLDVVITDSHLDGVYRVLEYVSEIRKSDGEPVFEGSGVFEPGTPILLLRHAQTGGAS